MDGWMDGYLCILKYKRPSVVFLSPSKENSFQGSQGQNWLKRTKLFQPFLQALVTAPYFTCPGPTCQGQHSPSVSVTWLDRLFPTWPFCARPYPAGEMFGLLRTSGESGRQPGTGDSDTPGSKCWPMVYELYVHRPAS